MAYGQRPTAFSEVVMRRVIGITVGLVLSSGLVLGAQAPDPKKVEAGKLAFEAQKCSICHAIAGKGGKLASALDDVGKKLTEADIRKWLTDPASMEAKLPKKPAMLMSAGLKGKKLTPADIDNLTAYMLTLK
jgi:mono/diheme cytochrome c family protein